MRGYLVFSVFKPLIFKLDLSDYLQTDLKPAKYHFETPFLPTEQRVRSNNSKIILHKFGLFFSGEDSSKLAQQPPICSPSHTQFFLQKISDFILFCFMMGAALWDCCAVNIRYHRRLARQ